MKLSNNTIIVYLLSLDFRVFNTFRITFCIWLCKDTVNKYFREFGVRDKSGQKYIIEMKSELFLGAASSPKQCCDTWLDFSPSTVHTVRT